jgi:hypothetical protein
MLRFGIAGTGGIARESGHDIEYVTESKIHCCSNSISEINQRTENKKTGKTKNPSSSLLVCPFFI